MKKFLMIAIAAMAVASQAATISWQLSPTKDAGFAKDQKVLLFVGAANETFGTDNLSLADYVNSLLKDGDFRSFRHHDRCADQGCHLCGGVRHRRHDGRPRR